MDQSYLLERLDRAYLGSLQGGVLEEGPPLGRNFLVIDYRLLVVPSLGNSLLSILLGLLYSLVGLLAVYEGLPPPLAGRLPLSCGDLDNMFELRHLLLKGLVSLYHGLLILREPHLGQAQPTNDSCPFVAGHLP
ncbi:hypothetical protein BVRB_5g110200 [Beta vulgaris subsp. vulgaris]|uniref:Uncharacterized protein n=1 Tax=Beta vulgaris subsp. vulgaris TaxID=3555 RepID=A0A0J8F5M8_BETVV|nr:hypothetical protein BVRB_5g110200 [Beta vulgaris subsp. vulgaris]